MNINEYIDIEKSILMEFGVSDLKNYATIK